MRCGKDAFKKELTAGLKNPCWKEFRLIVVHIGSNSGFLEGGLWVCESKSIRECHEKMNGRAFEDWFTKVIKVTEPKSVGYVWT